MTNHTASEAGQQRRRDFLVAMKLRPHATCQAKRHGVHFVIRLGERVFDYWPGTSNWRERDTSSAPGSFATHKVNKRAGNGLDGLLSHIDSWGS